MASGQSTLSVDGWTQGPGNVLYRDQQQLAVNNVCFYLREHSTVVQGWHDYHERYHSIEVVPLLGY